VTYEKAVLSPHCGCWGSVPRGQREITVDKMALELVLSELFSFFLPDIIPSILH
jgi:hypothetical protein